MALEHCRPTRRIVLNERTLGRSSLRISEIGFGCGAASGKGLFVSDNVELQKATVERALELGITYFDTAAIYGAGRSEIALGRALRSLDAMPIVATKIALEFDHLDDIPAAVTASVEGSLGRLGRDKVEVVYIHNRFGRKRAPKPKKGVGALLSVQDVLGTGGVLAGLEALRKRGLVQHFGCCAYGGETEAIDEVTASGRFDAMLVHYNLVNQSAWHEGGDYDQLDNYRGVAARAAKHGVGGVILRVLEAGTLAGNAREIGTANTALYDSKARAYDFLRNSSGELAPGAIRFALSNRDVSTVLVGIAEVAHVDAAVQAASLGPLSANELRQVEAARIADLHVA